MNKDIFGSIALVITSLNSLPYIWSIWRGQARPPAFSWIIWTLVMAICTAAQVTGGGGAGSWILIYGTAQCLLIAVLTASKAGFHASRSDWLMFVTALAAIPLWYLTADPFWSLILLMLIDGIGYWLTCKKAWFFPAEERALFYLVNCAAVLFSLAAMQAYNFSTSAYPVFLFIGNLSVVLVVAIRRYGTIKVQP